MSAKALLDVAERRNAVLHARPATTPAQWYAPNAAEHGYSRLYVQEMPQLRAAFSILHKQLNDLLRFMNEKRAHGGHYNADRVASCWI